MKSVCCRRPRFSWWPGGTCWAYICQRTSGTRLADQEGTPHKSRRAQAKPLPAKASGNSPPQIRDVVPPGSSGGNSMALFRNSRAYHQRQSWLLVIARVWSTPRVVRSALIAQVLPDNRASL
jgi:hypothetical protein